MGLINTSLLARFWEKVKQHLDNGASNDLSNVSAATFAQKMREAELAAILADPRTPVFAAFEGAALVGYGFCIFQQVLDSHVLTDIKTLYIDDLCVDEGCRGTGVGRALYEYILAFAREQGCYNVTLNVWSCNESALRFYEKMGLKPQKIGMETVL